MVFNKSKLLLTAALGLFASSMSAYDFEAGGIYYNIWSEEDKTVEVTRKSEAEGAEPCYSGEVIIPDIVTHNGKDYSVLQIGNYAFQNCSSLSSVTIPNSVTSIRLYAFQYCSGLTSIEIPKNTKEIESYTFEGCTGLTTLNIPNNITRISRHAFKDCTGLTSITIGDDIQKDCNTELSTPFQGCTNLKEATIVNFNYGFLMTIPELTSVTIIGNIGRNTLIGCTNLTTVRIKGEKGTTIPVKAFYGCPALKEFIIEDGRGSLRAEIDRYGQTAWDECVFEKVYLGRDISGQSLNVSTIREIVIGDNVTTLRALKDDIYTELDSLVIGKSVQTVPAFTASGKLRAVVVSSKPPMAATGFAEAAYANATLYVPVGAAAAYKEADVWKNFYNIQESEEVTAIESKAADKAVEVTRYDAAGRKLTAPQRGLNIVKMSDGTVRKVIVR